jgi:ABC-type transporter lipoprotein component MlaA
MVFFCLARTITAAQPASEQNQGTASDRVILPKGVPDPIEPLNRTIFGVNRWLMSGVIKPSSRVYRFIVRKPVRTGINNFNRNITYPGRVLNNLLQGKWKGAKYETDRFFVNTFAGGAGFVDMASQWKMPKSDADFGQTFGKWGWRPSCYVMLPVLGPSNERDALGFAADTMANPFTYLTPYPFTPEDPLTYLTPYTYYAAAATYNGLSDTVDGYTRSIESEKDAYATLQYAWTFVRANRQPDFRIQGEQDRATLETLQSALVKVKDAEFPNHSKTRSITIPGTGRKLDFTYWMQQKKAPIVYIVPGIGSHRLADMALALAELMYRQGFSAVCVSNPYNYEFMERASTAALPAYTPIDAHDLHAALTEIDRRLESFYPGKLGAHALMGYSIGAFQSLFISANTDEKLLQFDRYVAIDTPVRLLYGMGKLDGFFQAPLAWPAAERTDRLENTFLKVAALAKSAPGAQGTLPFEEIESKFLVGMAFRLILRDVIFTSQLRTNQGILKMPLKKSRRGAVYNEILQYSFTDYFEKFATPYYGQRGIDFTDPETLAKAADLRHYAGSLQANQKIRVMVNANDFLLSAEDLAWLRQTFEPGRLTVFENGGHLGNLAYPNVQKAITGALEGLGAGKSAGDGARVWVPVRKDPAAM